MTIDCALKFRVTLEVESWWFVRELGYLLYGLSHKETQNGRHYCNDKFLVLVGRFEQH